MPVTEPTTATTIPTEGAVALDLYRDIHKGIRAELFAVTLDVGRADPTDAVGRAALAAHVGDVMTLLVEHAEHEDHAIGPALEQHLPELAEHIESDHLALDARIAGLRIQALDAVDVGPGQERRTLHRLYLDLASFTGDYLVHQDLEERAVMPALEAAIGPEAVGAIHGAIVGPMPPEELARSLAVMVPAMNVDDRTELLGGMAAGAPPEVFEQVWGLVATVLDPTDVDALARRLGR